MMVVQQRLSGICALSAYTQCGICSLAMICPPRYTRSVNETEVGIELARLRRRAGLTQAALARRAGTTQAVISRLETGAKVPGFEALDRIVAATGREMKLTLGRKASVPTREERRRRVRLVLDGYQFDPWQRDPTAAEARSLMADGLDRERFARA
jgi:transcriptional regulator with XRE-family HTH domain